MGTRESIRHNRRGALLTLALILIGLLGVGVAITFARGNHQQRQFRGLVLANDVQWLREDGRFEEAMATIKKLESYPVPNYYAPLLRGDVLTSMGDYKAAAKQYAEALAGADPSDPGYREFELLIVRLKKEDCEKGKAWVEKDLMNRARAFSAQMKASNHPSAS